MKSTKTLFFIASAFLLTTVSSCSKEKSGSDKTTDVVGHYDNNQTGSSHVQITVTKVDDTHIAVAVETAYGDFTFANCTMNNNTAFTLSTTTLGNQGNYGDETSTLTGTGSSATNVISLLVHERRVNAQNSVTYEGDDTYTGVKQ